MDDQIGFNLSDILEFFAQKGGKVVYSELVTHFKQALSNPTTQAQARNLFKDHVNTVATVTNENGTKYLVLKQKYMRKLFDNEETKETTKSADSYEGQMDVSPVNFYERNGHQETPNHLYKTTPSSSSIAPINQDSSYDSLNRQVASSVVAPVNNNDVADSNFALQSDESDIPPRPPPRKKASFSKTKSPPNEKENNEIDNPVQMGVETNHEVKKEIQELARTPGRVKEHAQILNKLASSIDYKLPMPNAINSAHSQVTNKIRNGYHGADSDSGSLQIADSLKKKWIIAASNCDYNELCNLLKEDPNLSSYCDFITGYNALHWAAKFNRPNIIKLIAGKYGVNPNVKSFSGCTPLHLAAQFKHESLMKMLVDIYGANKDIRDNYGKKPFHYSESFNKKPNEKNLNSNLSKASNENSNSQHNINVPNPPSATENLKNNLRNKLSHQSMLVRNKFRQSKAGFQKRKASFSSKSNPSN